MNWSNFKYIIVWIVILAVKSPSVRADKSDYEKRVEKYQSKWLGLIPTHTKLQFAGSMGFLSTGFGWDYGRKNQWETDILIGFIPKFSTRKNKVTFTLKQNYIPWRSAVGEHFSIEPLTCGMYINTVFGEDFWMKELDRYPKGYYKISTKMRFNIFVGQRFTYKIPMEKRRSSRELTVFYEINTNDLYLISAIQNKYIKPTDYLGLSFGIKVQLF